MNREEALALVEANLDNPNLVKHCLAAEAVMRALARHFGEDQELWGLAGLVHDVDYAQTKDEPARHSLVGAQLLAQRGVDPRVVYAVKAHNDAHGEPRLSLLDQALYACEGLTGLITAAALIRPEKQLSIVTPEFVLNRFKEKSFARGVRREEILTCSEIGLTLEELVTIGLKAMQQIAPALGL